MIAGALVVLALTLAQLDGPADERPTLAETRALVEAEAGRGEEPAPAEREPSRARGRRCVSVSSERVAEARRWADDRAGEVSFAVLDECKRLVGDGRFRPHYSASVVKVMLMVAYLRRDDVRDDELTDSERSMLGPMITSSDNDLANQVYGIVGAKGLYDLANAAKMRIFSTIPVWGGSQISPGDQASFVGRLENYVPKRHETYALSLMADVIEPQRWGVPQVTLPGWNLHFKGGWSPEGTGATWRVNQVALLRRHDRRLSLSVLSSGQPDYRYGQVTIEGVAKRLLRAYRVKAPPSQQRPARPAARRASAASGR